MMTQFNFQPVLKGNRITLRPLLDQDFESLYKASSDPSIWEQLPRSERYQKDEFQKFFIESLSLKTTLIIETLNDNKIIGSSRYARFSKHNSEIEIGWTFLERKYWGNGYNTEAKLLMIEHAFQYVESVFFVAATTNIRSRKAIEKLNAVMEKELDWPPDADIQDRSVLYRMTKDKWNRMHSHHELG